MITVENANQYMRNVQLNELSDPKNQAKAWITVYSYCVQVGMDLHDEELSGLQKVIQFIGTRKPNNHGKS